MSELRNTPLLGSESKGWNFSNPDKENYMTVIEGTVVEWTHPVRKIWGTQQDDCWPNGDPKRDWSFFIRGRSGRELIWRFKPGSDKKPTVARRAIAAGLQAAGGNRIEDIIGKFVRISTEEGKYGLGNPRPWTVEILGEGELDKVRGVQYPDEKLPRDVQAQVNQAGAAAALKAVGSNAEVYGEDIPF